MVNSWNEMQTSQTKPFKWKIVRRHRPEEETSQNSPKTSCQLFGENFSRENFTLSPTKS